MSARPRRDELFSGGDRALELFCDRYPLIRCFAEYLNTDPPQNRILYFHGDGGNGKSLLLKYLRLRCCKRFRKDHQQQLATIAQAKEVAELIAQENNSDRALSVPAVLHDFGQPSSCQEDEPKNPFYGLLMLRRNLAGAVAGSGYSPLKFPLYDFACCWYLHKKGKSPEYIKQLFPLNDVVGLIAPLIDLFTKSPVGSLGSSALNLFGTRLGDRFNLYLQQRGLRREQIEAVCRKDPDQELINELPKLLAEDLNVAMTQEGACPRLVRVIATSKGLRQFARGAS